MAAPELKRLRRAEVSLSGTINRLQVEIVREADRKRKRAVPALERMQAGAWFVAIAVSSIEPSTPELPRLYLYWHLKRMLKWGMTGSLGSLDDESVDKHMAFVRHGVHAAAVTATIDDKESPVHFRAARWIAEQWVFRWLIECNLLGASPSSIDLFTRFRARFPAGSASARYTHFVQEILHARHHVNKWANTFRRRWRMEFTELPKANAMSDASLSNRVGVSKRAMQELRGNSARIETQHAHSLCARHAHARDTRDARHAQNAHSTGTAHARAFPDPAVSNLGARS